MLYCEATRRDWTVAENSCFINFYVRGFRPGIDHDALNPKALALRL